MPTVRLTNHAVDRVNNRLAGLVTFEEIASAVNGARLAWGDNYIDVKKLDKYICLGDPYDNDTPKGDKITLKITWDEGGARVITVMLRKSSSKSDRYS